MTQPSYQDYIANYTAVLEAYYAQTRLELYPDNGEESPYHDAVQPPQLISSISEKYGFLMLVGQTISVLEQATHEIETNDPKSFAHTFLEQTIETIKELTTKDSYIEHIETTAAESFENIDLYWLHFGHAMAQQFLEERLSDYLEISPLTPAPRRKRGPTQGIMFKTNMP